MKAVKIYSDIDIDDQKAEPLIHLMSRPRTNGPTPNSVYEDLENRITFLSMPEIFGLIIRCSKEDIRVLLRCLDDLRWVLVSTQKVLSPELLQNQLEIAGYPRMLSFYNWPSIPRSVWADAAEDYKQLCRCGAEQGLLPGEPQSEWSDFSCKYIDSIDETLSKMGIVIYRAEPGWI